MGATYNNTEQGKWLLSDQIMTHLISEINVVGAVIKTEMYLPAAHVNI